MCLLFSNMFLKFHLCLDLLHLPVVCTAHNLRPSTSLPERKPEFLHCFLHIITSPWDAPNKTKSGRKEVWFQSLRRRIKEERVCWSCYNSAEQRASLPETKTNLPFSQNLAVFFTLEPRVLLFTSTGVAINSHQILFTCIWFISVFTFFSRHDSIKTDPQTEVLVGFPQSCRAHAKIVL